MYVLKGLVKGDFEKSLHLEIHSRRTFVTNTLTKYSPTENDIDNLIEVVPEVIHQDDEYLLSVQNEDQAHILPSNCVE